MLSRICLYWNEEENDIGGDADENRGANSGNPQSGQRIVQKNQRTVCWETESPLIPFLFRFFPSVRMTVTVMLRDFWLHVPVFFVMVLAMSMVVSVIFVSMPMVVGVSVIFVSMSMPAMMIVLQQECSRSCYENKLYCYCVARQFSSTPKPILDPSSPKNEAPSIHNLLARPPSPNIGMV